MNAVKKVCYCLDGEVNTNTLNHAINIANEYLAELTILCVVGDITKTLSLSLDKTVLQEIQDSLIMQSYDHISSTIQDFHCAKPISILVESGKLVISIVQQVIMHNFDFIIKDISSRSLLERVFVSDDMHLLRKCPCPTLLIPSNTNKIKRIVAFIDFDSDNNNERINDSILQLATVQASLNFAELYVVHVWDLPLELSIKGYNISSKTLDHYLRLEQTSHLQRLHQLRERFVHIIMKQGMNVVKPKFMLEKGEPSVKIPEICNKLNVDLVVMGTLGRSGLSGFLIGNTSERVIENLRCALLAVKPADFTSPIKPVYTKNNKHKGISYE